MDLSGAWWATPADDDLRRQFASDDLDETAWEPVSVPGHWRTTAAFADHDGPMLFRRRFTAVSPPDGRRAWLTLEGVFSQGDVWLDGVYLGVTDGYFVPHRFDVTEMLRSRSEHVLAIEVGSPPPTDRDNKRLLTGAFSHGSFIDRRWNPGGIWRPVHLVETGDVSIRHSRLLCVAATEAQARLQARLVIDSPSSQRLTFRTIVAGVEHEHRQLAAAGENRVQWTVDIERPDLWWPHSLGAATLHDVVIDVMTEAGEVTDTRTCRTGFRRVVLDGWKASVNGERIFLKGAALGPVRRDMAHVSDGDARRPIERAIEAGLDLLRVHTHIAPPLLYAAADELGMLLWQDLPLHKGYARSVRDAAVIQARWATDLLGHHPSVALWCAHDEPHGTDAIRPRPAAESILAHQAPSWNRSVLDLALKRELSRSDPTRPVIAHSGVLPHFPQLDGTATHLWFGWHEGRAADLGQHLRDWPRQARFVGAFGAQSVPDDAEFAQPERWPRLDWTSLAEHHTIDAIPLLARFPPDRYESFDAWRRATQRHQAHVVKTTVELLRRLKYRPTGGFVLMALNDTQPAISFSVLDHRGEPKPAFRALSDACRPVIVVADPFPASLVAGTSVELDLHVVNDRRRALTDLRLDAALIDPDGVHRWSFGGEVPADTCVKVGRIVWRVPISWGDVTLDLTLRGPAVDVTNRYLTRLPLS